nr:peptidoglycan DD-metalloendopeptidase family protein [Dissulfurirhabdus thermomarina]
MISREAYIRRILSRDKDLRGRYRRRLAELKATAARLERDRAALKKAAARLEAEALRLEERKREREAFVQELRQQGERYRALLAELESAKQSLEAVIGQLSRAVARAKAGVPDTAAFEAQKGRLLPPVRRGRLLYSTSKADDAAGHLVLQGAGVVFGAPYGSEIRAVFDGHVVYNDVLPGYGKVLIIDHGEGFYSLVAQGAKYFKAVGDEVSEGETVGLVGGGPWADEGVYFEIRYKGKAEDPLAWLDREVLDQMAAQAEQP